MNKRTVPPRCTLYDLKYQAARTLRGEYRRNAYIPGICAIAAEAMLLDKPVDPKSLNELISESDKLLRYMVEDGQLHYRMLIDSERALAEKDKGSSGNDAHGEGNGTAHM